jgi:hypothetical protein
MIKYLFLDTECGGGGIKYSLLTVGLVVTDENFKVLDTLNLRVKPDDGYYIVSGQGMAVNKINLATHDKIATPYKQAKQALYAFLWRLSNSGKQKLTPVGHGVKGDMDHLFNCLISIGSWEQFCTYHYIDTSVVLQFLRAADLMPLDIDGSVEGIAKYFNIPVGENLHDALEDAFLTHSIYQRMLKIVKDRELPLFSNLEKRETHGPVTI